MVEYYQRSRHPDLDGGFYEVHGDNKDKTDRQFTGTYVPQELILVYERTKYKILTKCDNLFWQALP